MNRHQPWRGPLVLLAVLVCGCNGFIWEHERRDKADLGVEAQADTLAGSPAVRDTIGAISYYEGLRPLHVRGYGLVVGLGQNGSRTCPKAIRERLVQNMYKQRTPSGRVVGVRSISPEQLIDDVDTAVVLVQGQIPPASVAGTRFDVFVTTLPGTETRSLRGGRLYTADLEVYRPVSGNASISGQVVARAAGPVFLNPFTGEGTATESNPLHGMLLGGGVATQARRIRLVLTRPSYGWVRRIRDRINAQFPGSEIVADAISPSFVQLQIPSEYHGDELHFLSLVRSLYLSPSPEFEATRAHELGEEIVHPGSPHALIASAFEGLGRAALPVLNSLYAHPKEYVSFHAAAAGLRLGDHIAGDAIGMHAENPASTYRFQAIRALGAARGMAGPAMTLRRLMEGDDPRVATAAYEALIRCGDTAIESTSVGGDSFVLDRVPTRGPNLAYVKRHDSQRIALFGQDLRCTPPIFYRAPDGSLIVTAQEGDESLTVIRVVVASGSMSPPTSAPLGLAALIRLLGGDAEVRDDGEIVGLGLDYGATVRALHHLCTDRSINASFMLEQPNVAELFGPPRPIGRPESEL